MSRIHISSSNHFLVCLFCAILCMLSSCQKDETTVPPTLSTIDITSISANSAASGGNIMSDGGAAITARGIVWSTNSNPVVSLKTKTIEGAGTGNFASSLTGLLLSTKYYVRAYATNSRGTFYGNEVSFTTTFGLPLITTSEVAGITSIKANSGGTIADDGGAKVIVRGIVWSSMPNPSISLTTKTLEGSGLGSFTSNLFGLSKSTKYYVRAYATNSHGTAYGEEKSFTTGQYPSVFNILFDGLESQWTDIAPTNDGGFIMSAKKYIIKTDSLGVIQWRTELSPSSPALYQIFQSKDGGYILCNHISVQKFNSSGNRLWIKEQPTFNYVYNSVLELNDGYIVAGITGPSNTGTITKLNLDGIQVWEKFYDKSVITNCIHIAKTADGNFITAGGVGMYSNILAIAKIDPVGNIIWSNQYPQPNTLVSTLNVKVIETENNNFVISSNTSNNYNILSTRVISIDGNGVKKWEKNVLMGDQVICNSFISLSDSGFIIAGSTNYGPRSALIVKLDKLGNQIWNKKISQENSLDYTWEFNAALETKGNMMTFLGYKAYVYSGAERGLWLLRTDNDGNY